MITWIPDRTGRFRRRPYFPQDELDRRCERVITRFTRTLYGFANVRVPTGALIKLLERDAAELNHYADLRSEGDGVEGVTYFSSGRKPLVCIARELYQDHVRAHRLRYTLAHEYGHVYWHAPAWRRRWIPQEEVLRCLPNNVLTLATGFDWMEWQASYAGGALLMPRTWLHQTVIAYFRGRQVRPLPPDSRQAHDLQQLVSEAYEVSADAARVRLSQLGYLGNLIS
jgi:hypothetical protein